MSEASTGEQPARAQAPFRPAVRIVAGVLLFLALAADGFFVSYAVKIWRQGTNPAFAYWFQQACWFHALASAMGILVPVPAVWVLMRGTKAGALRWAAIGLSVLVAVAGVRGWAEFMWTTTFACYDTDVEVLPLAVINHQLAIVMGEDLHVPATARDVHAYFIPPIDPGVALTFTVAPGEAQEFAEAVRRRLQLDAPRAAPLPKWVLDLGDSAWWKPKADVPFSSAHLSFVQADADSGTVYLFARFH
jgi:hypothetical protein